MVIQGEARFEALNNWVLMMDTFTQYNLQESSLRQVGKTITTILQMRKLKHWEVK